MFHSIIACRILLHLREAASFSGDTSPDAAAAGAMGGGRRAARHGLSKGIVSTLLFRTRLPSTNEDSERGLATGRSDEYEISPVVSGDVYPDSPSSSRIDKAPKGMLGSIEDTEQQLRPPDRQVQWT